MAPYTHKLILISVLPWADDSESWFFFNIQHKCCSFLNSESSFQDDHEEILSCLNYKHLWNYLSLLNLNLSGIKSFGSLKKISFLSHLLKARLKLETADVCMVPSQASKIGERIPLERFALGEAWASCAKRTWS